jgi:hypothetical protein
MTLASSAQAVHVAAVVARDTVTAYVARAAAEHRAMSCPKLFSVGTCPPKDDDLLFGRWTLGSSGTHLAVSSERTKPGHTIVPHAR